MRPGRSARLSVAALAAQRARAGLTLAGIAIGVASVLVTAAIGAGAQREIAGRIDAMGTNLLVVRPAQVRRLVSRGTVRGQVTSLVREDAEAIASLPAVDLAAPAAETSARVKAGTAVMVATVRGTSPDYLRIRRLRLRAGHFFDESDDAGANRVAVIGARVASTLFPRRDPIGQEIRVRGVPFDVVGVLPVRGVLADGSDEDAQVLVPLRTAMRRLLNVTWLNGIFVGAARRERTAEAAEGIRALLRARHGRRGRMTGDDFEVQDGRRYLAMQQATADSLTKLGAGLGGLALLVGSVGIVALMLLSVKERTAEIGLRIAVGATPRDVFAQFVLEAILLALGGWVAGACVAAAAAAAIALGTSWPVALPVPALLVSFAMAAGVGVGAGVFPAQRASLVPPHTALVAK
jgi:putative ABC transport system permease protein